MKTVRAISAAVLGMSFAVAAPSWAEDKPYTVEDGKVDEKTWVGMKIYERGRCETCHGADANGGAAFPSLVKALQNNIDREALGNIVANGRNTMPPMKDAVMSIGMLEKYGYNTEDKAVDALYAYLKGRSDGAFGPKVKKMKK